MCRTTAVTSLLAAGLLAGLATGQEPRELPPPFAWEADLASAQAKARADGKPVIAYFTFDTCVWCKRLQDDIWPDPRVAEAGEGFHWVYVDRDEHPELVERFSVSAYPGLLVLGLDGENVHRFHGYAQVPEFVAELAEARRRYALYRAGERFWFPPPRPERISPDAEVVSVVAASDLVPGGLVVLGRRDAGSGSDAEPGQVLAVHGDALWTAAWPAAGEVDGDEDVPGWRRIDGAVLPRSCQDLTAWQGPAGGWLPQAIGLEDVEAGSHADLLLALPAGWTGGAPVAVLDARTGARAGEIAGLDAGRRDSTARGIALAGPTLHVLEIHGRLHRVDLRDGTAKPPLDTGLRWTFGLTHDGTWLWCGSRDGLHCIDPETGEVRHTVPTNVRLRALAADRGARDLLFLEQPVFGHDVEHRRMIVSPKPAMLHRIANQRRGDQR